MKKLLSAIILGAMCCCFVFAACDISHSYKIVSFVSFVSGGKKTYYTSYARLKGGAAWTKKEKATRYEYEKAEYKYKIGGEGFLYDLDLDTTKTISSFRGLTEKDIGCYLYWGWDPLYGTSNFTDFFKYKFEGWEYRYLHVKVINDTRIKVYVDPLGEAQATTYEVTSYSIGKELK